MIYDQGDLPKMSDDPVVTWSREATWQVKTLISPLFQSLWPTNMTEWWIMVRGEHAWSHVILCNVVMCSYMSAYKRNISSLAMSILLNIASLWLKVRWTHPWSHMSLWPPAHMMSRGKLKTKYFFLHKTYVHQALQGAKVWWNEAHNEVAWLRSSDHKRSRVKLKI